MKIAIKAVQIAPGGGLTHLNKMIEWFGRLAPETEFLLLTHPGQERLFVDPPANFRYLSYRLPGINLGAQLWWERHVMPGIIQNHACDLLFEPGNRGTQKSPCPKVSLVHNIAPFFDEYRRYETNYQKLRLAMLKKATIESLRASQGVIFISEYCRKLFSRHINLSRTKSTVIYHGRLENPAPADEDILKKLRIETPYILCVSHIWRYKKMLEMVRSYILAAQRRPDLPPLIIAGTNYSPEYLGEIINVIQESGMGERVRFVGNVPESELASLYPNCRAFLFPSVIEACPNILIEALSSGCAIACSDRGVMPEIASDAALYFDPDNIEEFSSSDNHDRQGRTRQRRPEGKSREARHRFLMGETLHARLSIFSTRFWEQGR